MPRSSDLSHPLVTFGYEETEKTDGKVHIPIVQGGGEEPTKGGQGASNGMHHCRVVEASKREGKA